MKNTKQSITFKVVIGYVLLAAVAAVAVWFIYSQVVKFSSLTRSGNLNNEQLVLVSEIATELYETESLGRRFIQTGDSTDLKRYSTQIADIQSSINDLRNIYADSVMKVELDSISTLLALKGENLEELLELRSRDRNTNYYREVIRELQKVDSSFIEPDYKNRFSKLAPHQRKALIALLEFAPENHPTPKISADSLILSVKRVLTELERQNQIFRETVDKKEEELLVNDLILNEQLRNLLAVIEQEERQISLAQAEESQMMLNDISQIIIIVGAACILIILLFLLLILRDVSRSQRYRVQLEEAKSFTESLMKRRERFMAAITHDLRSPLNTVIGYTELMKKTGLNTKQEHYLGHLKKSSEYILHLVNDLLDLSKLEAGKMNVERLPFNPKNLLEETFYNTIPEDDNKNLKLNVIASPEADSNVLSDPFRIKQILSNLITNAYKFTEKGEVTAYVSMKKVTDDNYDVAFSIKDTGIGISKSKQQVIFNEFSQEHGEIEKLYGGTGLGLAITKRITRLLKGNIHLESEPGKGSEFTVTIPVTKLQNEIELPPATVISEYDLNGKNILVVDDETSQLALSKELIKSVGMNCDTATNGEEALIKLRTRTYHLVLTDIQMPKMDGYGLLEEMQRDPELKDIPVIAVSGRTKVSKESYREAGFSENLLKPYKPEDLLQKIGKVLNLELEKKKNSQRTSFSNGDSYSLDEIWLFTGEDQTAMDTILTAFIDSTRLNLEEIEQATQNNNPERVAQIAHRMLPMFKQLKAKGIIKKLEKLERKEDLNPKPKRIQKLIIEVNYLLGELEKETTI